MLLLVFAPLGQEALARRPVKNKPEPMVTLMSELMGLKKAARVKRLPTELGDGDLVEKFNERGVLQERVASWDDLTVVELDRNGDGYMDEWQAFSDRGHLRLSKPQGGHFTEMAADLITHDRRYKLNFHRDASGVFRLDRRSVAKLQVEWQEAGHGAGTNSSDSAAESDWSLSEKWRKEVVKPGGKSRHTNPSVSREELKNSLVDKGSCGDSKFPAKSIPESFVDLLTQENPNRYLRCLRGNRLDAYADRIEARLYRKLKNPAQSSAVVSCKVCPITADNSDKVCGNPNARAATVLEPTQDNAGNGMIYMVHRSGGAEAGASRSKADGPSSSENLTQDDLFHELLHVEKMSEDQVAKVDACCASHGTPAGCGNLNNAIIDNSFYDPNKAGSTTNSGTSTASSGSTSGSLSAPGGGGSAGSSTGSGGSPVSLPPIPQQGSAPAPAPPAAPAPVAQAPQQPASAPAPAAQPGGALSNADRVVTPVGGGQPSKASAATPLTTGQSLSGQTPVVQVPLPAGGAPAAAPVAADPAAAKTADPNAPATGPLSKAGAQAPTAAQAMSGADAGKPTAAAPAPNSGGGAQTATPGAGGSPVTPAAGAPAGQLSKADVQGPTAAQATKPDAKPDVKPDAKPDAKPAPSTSPSVPSSTQASEPNQYRRRQGPQVSQNYDSYSQRQVAASFSQAFQAAVSVMSQNIQAPAVNNPSEPTQGKKSPVVAPVAERANRPDAQGAPAQALAQPKTAAPSGDNGRTPASVADPKAAKDPQAAAAKGVSGPAGPGSVVAAKTDTKSPSAKSLFAAASPAAAVRQKAKRGDPVARRIFITQMTKLSRDEMNLALSDHEVQHSLKEYVIGAIDDRHKRRDQALNPKDWLIYNAQKQRLVHKQLGLARK